MELSKRVALVTGGSHGIGAETAVALAEGGADVAIVSRSGDKAADEVIARVQAAGRRGISLTGNMARANDCRRVVEEAARELGGVDVLVHNAGGNVPGPIDGDDVEAAWYAAFDVHVHAAFHLVRAALPHLRRGAAGPGAATGTGGGDAVGGAAGTAGAAIILVSSVAGLRGVTGITPYSTVKGALLQFGRSLASELADDNIRVNCISPGIIRTRFHDGMSEDAKQHNLSHRIPLHREGTPAQVAEGIRFLAENDYITGENITLDGGLTMRMR
ncbi:MAG: SDR family oxidoreductase [Spirochaetes bacterium]|jgi:NAD(P)-dependent dehydrogenase (short-subunit alcohol dehydrogenase family)|nr:SDR family oxidoreductase [Spirochaetota bacterium]